MGFAAFLLVRNAVLPGYRLAAIHAVAVLAAGLAGANLPAGHRNRRNSAQFHGLFPALLVPVGQHARAIAPAFVLAPGHRKSNRLDSRHSCASRMPTSA